MIDIDRSWLKCGPVGKGRFDEKLRDVDSVSEHFAMFMDEKGINKESW